MLVDSQGLDALTMPALASRLECGVMTVYGYVESKEDLLGALAQRALADLQLPQPLPGDTGEILELWGVALRHTLLRHPSLSAIFLSQPVVGPGIFYGLEAMLTGLDAAGCGARTAVHAIYAVITYTVGFVAWETPRTRRQSQEAYLSMWRQVFSTLPPAELPLSATVIGELGDVAGADQFEFGLSALVAGLVARAGMRADL